MVGRTISELNTMLSPVAWSSRRTSPSGRPANFCPSTSLRVSPLAPFDRLTAPLASNPVATQPTRTSTIMRRSRVMDRSLAGLPRDHHSSGHRCGDGARRSARRRRALRPASIPSADPACRGARLRARPSRICGRRTSPSRRPHGSPNPETRPGSFPPRRMGGAARSAHAHSLPVAAMGRRLIDRSDPSGFENSSSPAPARASTPFAWVTRTWPSRTRMRMPGARPAEPRTACRCHARVPPACGC